MTMKKLVPSLLLTLALLIPAHSSMAQDIRENLDNDVLTQMQSEGWRIVKNGVLQRELRAGEVESFVFGSAGFTWKLQELRGMVQKYQKEFNAHPSAELRKLIAGLRKEMVSTQKMIQQARAEEAAGQSGIDKVSCSIDFTYNAAAGAGASVQGTNADASATFTGNCGFTGEVYATAYAQVTVGGAPITKSMVDGPRSGASVTASASATLNGGAPCESNSYASVTSPKFTSSYSKTATNSVCPLPTSLSLSMSPASSSTAPINLYADDCVLITWTASSTATFYRNNVSQGSRTSYSETVCNAGFNNLQQIAVYATAGTATSPTKTAYIQHHRVIDPTDCNPTCQ
jgi:hypothetical protein